MGGATLQRGLGYSTSYKAFKMANRFVHSVGNTGYGSFGRSTGKDFNVTLNFISQQFQHFIVSYLVQCLADPFSRVDDAVNQIRMNSKCLGP